MQYDRKGLCYTDIPDIMTRHNINIANMKLYTKMGKGDIACCIIETDETIPEDVEVSIQNNINVVYARVINIQ